MLVAAGGLALLIAGARRRAWPSVATGLIGIAASATASAWLLAVPAFPTSYAVSPVRYTTTAIVEGAGLFAGHCVACHGSDGTGGGPVTAGLSARPANLVQNAARHRPGELYWSIAHGRAGTSMPSFSPALGGDDIWSIVQFLHARSDAAALIDTNGKAAASPPLPAPDFSVELPGRGQQTLLQPDGPRDTLLVLYTLPDSLARLRSLASERRAFDDQRIRVLAVTSSAAEGQAARAETPGNESMLAIAAPDVAAAYAMLAAGDGGVAAPGHAEFLIDRRGQLRARWLGVPAPGVDRSREIFEAAEKLDRERPLQQPPHEHAH